MVEQQRVTYIIISKKKIRNAFYGVLTIALLIAGWSIASGIREKFIGWIELSGGRGVTDGVVNTLLTLSIFFVVSFGLLVIVFIFASIFSLISNRMLRHEHRKD